MDKKSVSTLHLLQCYYAIPIYRLINVNHDDLEPHQYVFWVIFLFLWKEYCSIINFSHSRKNHPFYRNLKSSIQCKVRIIWIIYQLINTYSKFCRERSILVKLNGKKWYKMFSQRTMEYFSIENKHSKLFSTMSDLSKLVIESGSDSWLIKFGMWI